MERILFIIPAPITYENFVHPDYNARIVGKYASVLTDMPIGVLSMSSYIKAHTDAQVKLIDFSILLNKIKVFSFPSFEDYFDDVLSRPDIKAFDPTIIGISVLFSPAYSAMLDLIHVCKYKFPNATIVAGGSVPQNMTYDLFTRTPTVDGICYGEGEKPMVNLINASHKLDFMEQNPSWITANKPGPFQMDLIENLDEIPFYDYGLVTPKDYRLNPAIEAYSAVAKDTIAFHIMTSRGCPHKCTFCGSHTVHGRKMRYFSIERVKEDLERLRKDYGATLLVPQDDHFVGTKKRALELIKLFKDMEFKVVFQNALPMYALDRTMLMALKDAGVNQLVLAIESGSDRVLRDIMHKPATTKIIKKVCKLCRELDIYMDANIIIGMPGETKQDIEDSRQFLRTIYVNWFRITVATPLPGSEMEAICLDKGYLPDDYMETAHYKHPVISTPDWTPEYIKEMQYVLNLELNFIYNSDFLWGNYEGALHGFKNAIRAKPDHAIAYYKAAQCYENLGRANEAIEFFNKAESIRNRDPFWKKYMETYELS